MLADIVSGPAAKQVMEKPENYSCRQGLLPSVPDPNYTVRAWRGVVTYLLRQHEFLCE